MFWRTERITQSKRRKGISEQKGCHVVMYNYWMGCTYKLAIRIKKKKTFLRFTVLQS